MSDTSRRAELYSLLGDLPERDRPVSGRVISSESRDGFDLERLELDLNGIEPVPAIFVRPKPNGRRVPVVLFNHSHGGFYHGGKTEML